MNMEDITLEDRTCYGCGEEVDADGIGAIMPDAVVCGNLSCLADYVSSMAVEQAKNQ